MWCMGRFVSRAPIMRTLLNRSIGARTRPPMFTIPATLWYVAVAPEQLIKARQKVLLPEAPPAAELSSFWFCILFGAPLLGFVLPIVMLSVYAHESPKHPGIFWPSVIFCLSPIVYFPASIFL